MLACQGDDTGGAGRDTGEGLPSEEPVAKVDALVVGSGLSGLIAAWELETRGADFLVVERNAEIGGASRFAGNWLAVGTRWQADEGVEDDLQTALDQWHASTGGDGDDVTVRAWLGDSAELLEWLEAEFSPDIEGPVTAPGEPVARIHTVGFPTGDKLSDHVDERVGDRIWTQTSAEELVWDDEGRVRGLWVTLSTGERGWIQAESVLIATGGYARDLERVLADRPGLSSVWPDHYVGADGGGRGLMAGLPVHNGGNYGVQIHGIRDWREGFEGEILWVSVEQALVVDAAGQRLGNEEDAEGFYLSHVLEQRGGGAVYAIWPESVAARSTLRVPAFNWAVWGEPETFTFSDAEAAGVAAKCFDLTEAAQAVGLDPATLIATVERYNELARKGEDLDYGKEAMDLLSINARLFWMAEVTPASSKAFTGLRTNALGQVLGEDGEVIPGLYASGEAAGVLGTDAVGWGFNGSASAVAWTGRNAARNMAR